MKSNILFLRVWEKLVILIYWWRQRYYHLMRCSHIQNNSVAELDTTRLWSCQLLGKHYIFTTFRKHYTFPSHLFFSGCRLNIFFSANHWFIDNIPARRVEVAIIFVFIESFKNDVSNILLEKRDTWIKTLRHEKTSAQIIFCHTRKKVKQWIVLHSFRLILCFIRT